MYKGSFFKVFELISDTRQEGKIWHEVVNIFFIVIAAVICGCNDFSHIHTWETLEMNEKWLKKHLILPNGIPSKSTISRVFNSEGFTMYTLKSF